MDELSRRVDQINHDLSDLSNNVVALETKVPMMANDIKEIKKIQAESSKQMLKLVSTFRGVVISSTAMMGFLVIMVGIAWKVIAHFL